MIINKKKDYKKIIMISVIVLLLFLITIILVKYSQHRKQQKRLEQEIERVKQYTALTDFKTLEEVALYLNCKFIKQEDSKIENIDYNVYMELPVKFDGNSSDNKNFAEKLIQFSAYVLNYKNFIIQDEKNGTSITVICNEEKGLVATYSINNTENYFDIIESKENAQKLETTETIKFEITSDKLNEIINNKWNISNIDFGTRESIYRNYDIYFDEGIEVRKVSGKIFNIIFTNKYQGTVINNLTTQSTLDEIKQILGKPQFESGNLIGYKGEKAYVFFYNNQISVYRTEEYRTDEIARIIQEKSSNNENEKVFVDEIKKVWKDFDIYEFDENNVKLQYTLKGLCIKYDSTTKKGVIVYNNYNGKVYGDTTLEDLKNNQKSLPNYIHIENKDLVFEEEKNRVNRLDDSTSSNNYMSAGVILNTSNKFKVVKSSVNSDEKIYNIRFVSIGNQVPNSELREMITSGMWFDDDNFIYSAKGRGIFVYNATERTYKTITTGSENYRLKGISDNILYYDENSSIEINL